MGWRCDLCDDTLPIFQLSRLCPTCYKVRTIVKCYDCDTILDCLEKTFKVDYKKEEIVESNEEKDQTEIEPTIPKITIENDKSTDKETYNGIDNEPKQQPYKLRKKNTF